MLVVVSYAGVGTVVKLPIPAMAGISIFAIFYLMAQFVERVVEPFSEFPGFGDSNSKDEKVEFARAISIWGFATFLGVLLCSRSVSSRS